jgi:hypothetical protein
MLFASEAPVRARTWWSNNETAVHVFVESVQRSAEHDGWTVALTFREGDDLVFVKPVEELLANYTSVAAIVAPLLVRDGEVT